MASFSNAMIGVPEKTRNLEEMKLFDDYCHHVTTLKLHTFAPYSQPATKLALKLECASSSRGVLLAGGFCPAPRSTLTLAAAATIAAAIVLKPSSSHENYVFMCDAEKSIPKSENLIIL